MNPRMYRQMFRSRATLLACLVISSLLAACKSPTAPLTSARLERSTRSDTSEKLSNATKLLMDSFEKPTAPFHFSYKGQENLNSKYPMDKTAKPEVGPVEVEADVVARDDAVARGAGDTDKVAAVLSSMPT